MSRRRGLSLLICAALPLSAQSPAAVGERLRAVLADGKSQVELPHGPAAGRPRQDGAPASESRRRRPRTDEFGMPQGRPRAAAPCFLSGLSAIGEMLMWTLLAVLVVVLAVAAINALLQRPARRPAPPSPSAPASAAAGPPAPALQDFEALALAGRFAEAVHAMLLHAFVALAARRGRAWPQADTGREILASVGGFAAADAALVTVFRTAEGGRFGKLVVGAADYAACRARFIEWHAACRANAP